MDRYKNLIQKEIEKNSKILITSPTGTGKSTFIPQILCEKWQNKKIALIQPRRLAVLNIYSFLSKKMKINYKIRHFKKINKGANLTVMTDGIFIREILNGKTYDFVIIDEVHERSLRTEFLLLYLQKTAVEKLIFMSATISSNTIESFFNCKRLDLKIKGFKSEIFYEKEPVPDYLFAAYYKIKKILTDDTVKNENHKDILVFLPGEDDIIELKKMLRRLGIDAMMVYSNATYSDDKKSEKFQPEGEKFQPEGEKSQSEDKKSQSEDKKFHSEGEKFQSEGEKFHFEDKKFQPEDEKFQSEDKKFQSEDEKFQSEDEKFQSEDKKFQSEDEKFQSEDKKFQSEDEKSHSTKQGTDFKIAEKSINFNLNDLFVQRQDNNLKVILATNIAETSVTIPNIKYVIDTGMQKTKIFQNFNYLGMQAISKESAEQRKGRCNRITDGICYRLYTEEMYQKLDNMVPEVLRCDLSDLILWLLSVKIDPFHTNFISIPSKQNIESAYRFLFNIGAICLQNIENQVNKTNKKYHSKILERFNKKCKAQPPENDQTIITISNLGRQLLKYPLDINIAYFFHIANEMNCGISASKIIALISEENHNFIQKPKICDILSLLELFDLFIGENQQEKENEQPFQDSKLIESTISQKKDQKFNLYDYLKEKKINITALKRAVLTHEQLLKFAQGDQTNKIEKAFYQAFRHNQTVRSELNGQYNTLNGEIVHVHPTSYFFKKKENRLVFVDVICTNRPYMRIVGRCFDE